MENFFKLKENNTTVATEVTAGITTFLAMSYIIFVNPAILSLSGMPSQAVFLATIFAAAVSTLIIGLFANVPYALAPGMGLNAFFTYTVVFSLGFTWQEALSMVFLCGILNVLLTVTKIRKLLITAIPDSLQHAISAGIGVFIGYVGIKNAGLLSFTIEGNQIISINNAAPDVADLSNGIDTIVANSGTLPALVDFTDPSVLIALFGLALTIALMLKKVKGDILIGIVATTLLAILVGVVDLSAIDFAGNSLSNAFSELSQTFLVIFKPEGLPSLFGDMSRMPLVLMTIFSFSLSDIFDTIGTFIGTGRRSGIFSAEDERALENSSGFSSKMDKALFADSIGTIIGALFGTSNTTTFVESAAGIGAGGRTGLTSVVTAICFLLSAFAAPIISVVPSAATAPALIIVGILMVASFGDINWNDFAEAAPAFFASIFMGLAYSISYGIAAGFIVYGLVKTVQGKARDVHWIIWVSIALFVLNFVIMAMI
ncbi:NCS2 family permease [Fundicoccus culcitae]|uniref:NCS2 family permease n=1 Tax=Fundicoccus culcitae TaxID=2969821 RepID=A0ABY5PA75_9LACT|nr:NCS2 family permease [Fundicoccus culcitae]UUX35310.1 NCS2 family permease [Fundicoccus culcitae]